MDGFARRGAPWALCLLLSLVGPFQVRGEEALPHSGDKDSLYFCFVNWPPYTEFSNGKASGLSVVLLREAARRIGMRAIFDELPWKRCLTEVSEGNYDVVVDAGRRDGYIQGPTAVTALSWVLWVRPQSTIKEFTGMSQFDQRVVAVVNGYLYGPDIDAMPNQQRDNSPSDLVALRKAEMGRVDGAIVDLINGRLLVDNNNLRLRPVRPALYSRFLYPAFNLKLGGVQRKFDRALADMLADTTVDYHYQRLLGLTFKDLVRDYLMPAQGG